MCGLSDHNLKNGRQCAAASATMTVGEVAGDQELTRLRGEDGTTGRSGTDIFQEMPTAAWGFALLDPPAERMVSYREGTVRQTSLCRGHE